MSNSFGSYSQLSEKRTTYLGQNYQNFQFLSNFYKGERGLRFIRERTVNNLSCSFGHIWLNWPVIPAKIVQKTAAEIVYCPILSQKLSNSYQKIWTLDILFVDKLISILSKNPPKQHLKFGRQTSLFAVVVHFKLVSLLSSFGQFSLSVSSCCSR